MRIQPGTLDDRGSLRPHFSPPIRTQPGILDDRGAHLPPFFPLIRIRHDTLDDRGGSSSHPSSRECGSSLAYWTTVWFFLPLRLPQYGSGTPSQTTVRVSTPLSPITIDKGRPSHVGTYGAKATQKPSTRDFHATGNRRTEVHKYSDTLHFSIRGLPGQGRYKGQAL